MNFTRFILGGLGFSIGFLVVACGGSTTGNGGNGDGNGSCTITAGNYTEHFTAEAGGTGCANIPDQTLAISGSETFSGSGDGGAGPADGGLGCTSNVSSSTCTATTSCTTTVSGYTDKVSSTFTFEGSSASGKETLEMTDATGKVISNCTYDVTMTKQ
jgi:hypothetical protein